jgi:PAS domain S-box-containing protein
MAEESATREIREGGAPPVTESALPAHVRQALVAGADSGVTVLDASGRIIYANASAARMIGYASPEALCTITGSETLTHFDIYHADGRPISSEEMPSRIALGGTASAEVLLRFRRRGAEDERWSLVRAIPVRDAAGKTTHAITFFREVSQQVRDDAYRRFLLRADQELTASLDYEKTLATIARLAVPIIGDWCSVDLVENHAVRQVAVAHVDPRKLAFLDELVRRYPHNPNATIGMPQVIRSGRAVLVPRIPHEALVAAAVDAEHLRLIEELRLGSYMCVPLRLRGTVVGAMTFAMAESGRSYSEPDLEFAQALGDRAALAIENARLLREVQHERASTEQTFRLMVEAVKDYAIFMLDPEGHVSTWNAGAALIKGYRADEIIGQHFSRFYTEEAVASHWPDRELELAARDGRFEDEGWRVRKDGSRFWANVVITALRDPNGALRGFAKITRDLSERKRAEDALQEETARRLSAEHTSHLAQLFVGVLGHDLRNPLSAIMTGASYLARIATNDKQSRALARITSSGERMTNMVEQLLDFTRFGIGGGIALEIVSVDLADLCRDVLEELAVARAGAPIRCEVIGDTKGRWDPARLEQVVSNLVGNAQQHGAPDEAITLSIDGTSDPLTLRVHNGGVIDAHRLGDLFVAFKANRANASSSGLGLGLYISHQIVRAHGGDIVVRSSVPAGTTFLVTLPRNAAVQKRALFR